MSFLFQCCSLVGSAFTRWGFNKKLRVIFGRCNMVVFDRHGLHDFFNDFPMRLPCVAVPVYFVTIFRFFLHMLHPRLNMVNLQIHNSFPLSSRE